MSSDNVLNILSVRAGFDREFNNKKKRTFSRAYMRGNNFRTEIKIRYDFATDAVRGARTIFGPTSPRRVFLPYSNIVDRWDNRP